MTEPANAAGQKPGGVFCFWKAGVGSRTKISNIDFPNVFMITRLDFQQITDNLSICQIQSWQNCPAKADFL